MGRNLNNRICPKQSRLPFPRRQIIRHPAGHLKDASGAAPAAGLRPVLDPPSRPPRTWQLPGKQETPLTHTRKPPAPQQNPPLTRPRSFRDDTEGSQKRTFLCGSVPPTYLRSMQPKRP